MKNLLGLCCSLGLSLGFFACATSDPIGTLIFEDSVREPDALEDGLEELPMGTPRVIASGEHAHLVLVDGATGAPLDRLKLPTDGVVMDLATTADPSSPWGVSHVFALVSPGEEELAQLFAMGWSEGAWGAPERIARFGGRTRMVGTSLGAVVMQQEDGSRWRLARLDKKPVSSTPCPMPQSIFSVSEVDEETVNIAALAFENETLVRVDATITLADIVCERTPIELPQAASGSVRGVKVFGQDILVDAQGGLLAFAVLTNDVAPSGFTTALTDATRIEDVVPFTIDRRAGFIAVTSGPPSLVVVELAKTDAGTLAASLSQVLLTGTPLEVGLGFTRIAAMNQRHGAVVTSAGLTPFTLTDDLEPVFGETTAFAAPIVALDGAE